MKAFVIPSVFTAIDKLSRPVDKMKESVNSFASRTERTFRKVGQVSAKIARNSFVAGSLIMAPLAMASNEAIKFEDRMADVGKTTGLEGIELQNFGQSILSLSKNTRTSIEELQAIAAIGGSMGIVKNELLGFTDSVNKFNVALGSDFGGVEEASKAISGLKNLFKETRSINVADAITKTGSAINALSAKGVNVPEVTEFISRVGQLPDAIKPSIQYTAALGATFNKAGISAEIGSRAFGDILLTAAQNLPKFAKQMNISSKSAAELINTDPTAFVLQFSESLNGLNAQKLSKTLKDLKLSDAGAIKTVGALASSTIMLSKFQGIANKEFEEGTSLLKEYNTKNSTTAAQLEKSQNNFKAFTIIIGTKLIPVINKLMDKILPLAESMINWAERNPELTKTIVIVAASLGALALIISVVAGAVSLVTSAIATWGLVTKGMAAAQAFLNAVMMANPIGLVILAIAALVGFVTLIIKKWNDWGASIALLFSYFMPGLMFIISLIQSLRRNWDMITEAFSKEGIIAGLKAIGATILDSLLMPLQQVLGIVAKVTGADWANNAVKGIDELRTKLGVNTETDESGNPLPGREAISNDVARQEYLRESISTQNQNLAVNINDKTGRAEVDSRNTTIPVKLTSTVGN